MPKTGSKRLSVWATSHQRMSALRTLSETLESGYGLRTYDLANALYESGVNWGSESLLLLIRTGKFEELTGVPIKIEQYKGKAIFVDSRLLPQDLNLDPIKAEIDKEWAEQGQETADFRRRLKAAKESRG